jgi:hypothetical protein
MKPVLISLFALTALFPASAKEPVKTTTELSKASAEMAEAANAFLKSLDEAQSKKARYPFENEERENWGFVPRSRNGIPIADLSPEQRKLARNLLESGMSADGLTKIDAVITLEGWLREIEKRPDFRNPENYFTTIFGEPSATGTWGWRFEGHHAAMNFTLVEGKNISVTPTFLGTNPSEVREGPLKGLRALAKEEDLGRALATALKDAGKPVLFSENPPNEILTAADRQIQQLEPVGVTGSEMTAAQKEGLITLISEYANRFRKEVADEDIAQAKAEIDTLHFGWAGSLTKGEAYYYRIQGKSFLIEAANIQNNANHVHTVWRDAANDFGRDALADHMKGHDH